VRARQSACYWPSGREIRRLSWSAAVELLDRMGADVEAIGAGGVRLSDLRELVHRLKAESHARGDCECSAAAYIRAGGGTAPPAGAQPAPGPRCRRAKPPPRPGPQALVSALYR